MPFTKFSNLDFDQIKTSIKDYLRANSNFTDFDFEGSNFSVLIDTLAYNTYINAFNANMIVNESFLDSATLRENVVSLARNIGYVPRSRTASKAQISFDVQTTSTSETITLKPGLVCVGDVNDETYTFSISENITTTIQNGSASFSNIDVSQGTYLTKQFVVDGSLDQKFTLDNSFIDTSTIVVYVKGLSDTGLGRQFKLVDNIINVNSTSEIYLIQEVQDEKYELLFGDGYFGKKLENGSVITVNYIVTDGIEGNGASVFNFAGSLRGSSDEIIVPTNTITVTTNQQSQNGADIESIDSVKYFASRSYESQYRAVTARDYESIVKSIYPNTESVSVIGGEEMDPPQFGSVTLSIKPKNGTYVSDFDKDQILAKLKQYTISGINTRITDLKVLYVELDSSVYYNSSLVSTVNSLKTKVETSLTRYSQSVDINKFGGRFKYSKALQIIDNTDSAITSNITKVKIRRDLKVFKNQLAQYEICFGNRFHVNPNGFNIKSTGFRVSNDSSIVYLTDTPTNNKMGVLSLVKVDSDGNNVAVSKNIGTVDYVKGEVLINTINIVDTVLPNDIIEIQAFPESNDVVGLKDLYLSFDVAKSSINMVRDVISSGDNVSGVEFVNNFYTSSYSNGELKRS
jgi:hypothetical protein